MEKRMLTFTQDLAYQILSATLVFYLSFLHLRNV